MLFNLYFTLLFYIHFVTIFDFPLFVLFALVSINLLLKSHIFRIEFVDLTIQLFSLLRLIYYL